MATPVPVAGGFAAALETFLSRGGSRVSKPRGKPGMRFSEGPIRGMTVEQATEKARGMWAKAPDSVKEKYAGREVATLAPSERRSAIAGIEAAPGMSDFSKGTRRATPGDLDGDGMQDALGATGAAGVAGAAGNPSQVHPTGKPGPWMKPEAPQVHPTGKPGPYRVPTDTPSAGGDVQVGMGANAGRVNPLTGKPIGYVPPAQAIPGVERPASAGMSFDPQYGAVPKAREVVEAPMNAEEYNRVKASQDVNDVNALDPRSPEASAARGRMRDYEAQQRAAAAAVARRERVGPSPAEQDAQQRKAARALDRRVAGSYGRI